MSPIAWLQYLAHVSAGDRSNVSPFLGGSWGSKQALYLPELAAPVLLALVAICLFWASMREHEPESRFGRPHGLAFVLTVGLANMLLSFALLSRALNYQLFFFVPVLVGLLVLSQLLLESTGLTNTGRVLIVSWLILALLSIGLRAAKIFEFSQSWLSRDPRPMLAFVKEQVPAKSIVLGSEPFYFWAVQRSGSRYLWIHENTTPGLSSHAIFDTGELSKLYGNNRIYLVWKHDSAMPFELSMLAFRRMASFEMPINRSDVFTKLRNRIGGGYPRTDVYELSRP
jgi:hypothetical protein